MFSLSAVLRSDSIYKADLADLCDFNFKQKLEPDPYHIWWTTVVNKAQFGKMISKEAVLIHKRFNDIFLRVLYYDAVNLKKWHECYLTFVLISY